MILTDADLRGLKSDLAYLDEVTTKLGFVRWQWEYTRATYDLKIEDKENREDYFLRFNTRAVEGKLESPYAMLVLEEAYIGRATFPHGLDYESEIPFFVLKISRQKIAMLRKLLSDALTVGEVMTKECVTLAADDSLHDAAVIMRDRNVGFLPVVDGRRLLGVVTDRDLVVRGFAGSSPETVSVSEIISKAVLSVTPGTTLDEAAAIMAGEQIRRLTVVENGELLGIVTLGDLATHNRFDSEVGETLGKISLDLTRTG